MTKRLSFGEMNHAITFGITWERYEPPYPPSYVVK